jgi:hypothetical protein
VASAPANVAASITPQHMLLNRNALFAVGRVHVPVAPWSTVVSKQCCSTLPSLVPVRTLAALAASSCHRFAPLRPTAMLQARLAAACIRWRCLPGVAGLHPSQPPAFLARAPATPPAHPAAVFVWPSLHHSGLQNACESAPHHPSPLRPRLCVVSTVSLCPRRKGCGHTTTASPS